MFDSMGRIQIQNAELALWKLADRGGLQEATPRRIDVMIDVVRGT